jgi:hypothetical protein
MQIHILRRKIKSHVQKASDDTGRKTPMLLFSLSLLVVVLLAFCVVQLTIVSVLSPRGKVLVGYNTEKEILVEQNRILEQKIAERAALGVITTRAESELEMDRADSVIYLQAPSVSAEAPAAP